MMASVALLHATALGGAPRPPDVVATLGRSRSYKTNRLYLGCHSDSGFTHQVRGFSSQMIFGESFEAPQANHTAGVSSDSWAFVPCAGCGATSEIVNRTIAPAHHGARSRNITIRKAAGNALSPTPFAGLRNRALANEGMYFEAGKEYEGYFFARCASPVTLAVRLTRVATVPV